MISRATQHLRGRNKTPWIPEFTNVSGVSCTRHSTGEDLGAVSRMPPMTRKMRSDDVTRFPEAAASRAMLRAVGLGDDDFSKF